jgi:hypothetical protein
MLSPKSTTAVSVMRRWMQFHSSCRVSRLPSCVRCHARHRLEIDERTSTVIGEDFSDSEQSVARGIELSFDEQAIAVITAM